MRTTSATNALGPKKAGPGRWLAIALWLCMLAGCGSTPQAALDQANHGAALTAALESELRTLRGVQAQIARDRLDSIRRLNTHRATQDAEGAFDERVQKKRTSLRMSNSPKP